jgi:hypothetical protein
MSGDAGCAVYGGEQFGGMGDIGGSGDVRCLGHEHQWEGRELAFFWFWREQLGHADGRHFDVTYIST